MSIPQLEEPRQGVEQPVRNAAAGFVSQRFHGRVQELVDEPIKGLADFFLGGRVEIGQAIQKPSQFILFGLLPAGAELPYYRASRAMVQIAHKSTRFVLDDSSGGRNLPVAKAAIVLAGRLQVVDRVEIDHGEVADRRLEISGNRQIEHKQRSMSGAA